MSVLVDLLICRGDEPWSVARPGIVYIVPTRFETVDEFKRAHLSRYMRLKQQMPKMPRKKPKFKGPRSDKGSKFKEPRAKETKPRKPRSDKGVKRKRKTYTLPK